jgi:hypothetical protein
MVEDLALRNNGAEQQVRVNKLQYLIAIPQDLSFYLPLVSLSLGFVLSSVATFFFVLDALNDSMTVAANPLHSCRRLRAGCVPRC